MAGGKLRLFACRSGKEFASKVGFHLNQYLASERKILDDSIQKCNPECYFYKREKRRLDDVVVESAGNNGLEFIEHTNGEFGYKIKEGDEFSVRGDIAYIIQLSEEDKLSKTSIHDNFMELICLIDTLNCSGVKEVHVVIPNCIPYSRQDAQSGREAVMTRSIARILESCNISSLTTIDVHSKTAFNNAYNIKTEALYSSSVIISALKEELNNDLSNIVVVSTDPGGAKKARYYANKLGGKSLVGIKIRPGPGIASEVTIQGDVNKKKVVIVDDIIDTAGTLIKTINSANEKEAEEIYCAATHGLFNRDSVVGLRELYNERKIKRVIISDSVRCSQEFLKENSWVRIASVTDMIGSFIFCAYLDRPVSSVYKPSEKF